MRLTCGKHIVTGVREGDGKTTLLVTLPRDMAKAARIRFARD